MAVGNGPITTLTDPRRILVYLHGDPWFIDPRNPICPVCGMKVKVVW